MTKHQEQYRKHKANHECVQCGKKLSDSDTGVRCEKCRTSDNEIKRVWMKNKRDHWREFFRCTECGKALREGYKYKRCPECMAKMRLRYPKQYEYQKQLYHERRKQGICVMCGKEHTVDGLARCEKCREKDRQYRKKYRDKKRQEALQNVLQDFGY